jgi:hypothetical protein
MKNLFELIIQAHPDFANEIEGCADNEIARFEQICPVPMPADYKAFLAFMGKNQGRIKVYCRPKTERTSSVGNYSVSIDYDTIFNDYLYKFKQFKKRNKNVTDNTPTILTGDLREFGEDPANFFYFGLNHLGNDNGNLFLDVRTPLLKVVEIDWYTRGILSIAPSFVEYLFNDFFKREASTYLHNRKWMDKA